MWYYGFYMSKNRITEIQEKIFNVVIVISYLLYIILLFGISENAPKYLDSLHFYVSVYVSFFLLIRFNPLRHHIKFNELDRKIAFSAGALLFTSVTMNYILKTLNIVSL